ncbi:MAG: hypothetical protein JWR16_2551 [Nevskia sp.]|nr:hypothetical protein [Nevskia sp.]
MANRIPAANRQRPRAHEEFAQLHEAGQDLGDFYPIGHIFAAFPHREAALAARQALIDDGWREADCRYFDDQAVRAGSQRGLEKATLLSSIGATLKMVELHRDLAAKGCHFLLIHAPSDELSDLAMATLRRGPISLAQRYQRFTIETLAQNDPLTGRQK